MNKISDYADKEEFGLQTFCDDNDKFEKFEIRDSKGEITKFSSPFTSDLPKIYLIVEKNKIHYVGTTYQPIARRIYGGLKANTYSYKWKNAKNIKLIVFCFKKDVVKLNSNGNEFSKNLITAKLDSEKAIYKLFIENIEAEVVLRIRVFEKYWSNFQHEIHFNNFVENGREIGHLIYESVNNTEGSIEQKEWLLNT